MRGKGQSRDEKTKRPGTCHMDRGQRETTSRRGVGGLSESLPEEGRRGSAEEQLFVGDREGQRKHTSFCYCVEEGEKDGGIILMA